MLPLLLAAVLHVGSPAPPLFFERFVQGPEKAAGWSALRGRAVVLEFWASWCAPCMEQLPHWNRLAAQFDGRPIQFIAASYEDEKTVRALLSERAMSGWVALDSGGATFQAFGVEAVPRTVLVDARGIVRGITKPQDVNEDVLEALIAGRPVSVEDRPAPT